MTKKIFVSQPMKGLTPEEIAEDRARIAAFAKAVLGSRFAEYEIMDTYFEGGDDWVPLTYLGNSLISLGKADIAVFGRGWSKARGCRLEHMACEEFGVPYLQEDEYEAILADRDFDGSDSAPEFWTEF